MTTATAHPTQAVPPTRGMRAPVALTGLRFLVGSTYVIYIAVSIFRTENFLFLLDAMLAVAVLFTVMSRAFAERTIAHGYLILLLATYTGCVLFAWFVLSSPTDLNALKTLRNLLYCVGVFLVALTYVSDRDRLASLLGSMAVLSALSAVYGLRQAIFGFWGFELDRLALMGSSLKEMLVLGRLRLTATFGDPLLCGFFMMTGLFVVQAREGITPRSRGQKRLYTAASLAMLVVLVASLTRAPLLGLVIGMATALATDFRLTRRQLTRVAWSVVAALILIGIVVWVMESGLLARAENPVLRFLGNGVSSVWSLIALFLGGGDETTYFLVEQSKNQRLVAWDQGLAFLASQPLGAGFSNLNVFSFSLGDTGILQLALLTGIPGALAYLCIAVSVLFRGLAHLRRTTRAQDRRVISALLGLWVAMLTTTAISSLATTSVAAVIMWLVAGTLVNVPYIFPVESSPDRSVSPVTA